jgi:uncharacterized protein (TIGR02996 family)
MDERDAFLRAVAANPEDDLPRLVFADWLEERGTPGDAARARFIRLQVELATVNLECSRYPGHYFDLLTESHRLAVRFAKSWLKELPPPVAAELGKSRVGADLFRRGFVESVKLSPRTYVSCAEQLCETTPVRTVHFNVGLRDLQTLLLTRGLQKLRGLRLSGNWVCPRGYRLLAAGWFLSELRELDLSGCRLEDLDADELADSKVMPKLTRIRLFDTGVSPHAVEMFANTKAFPALRLIEVARHRWGPDWEALRQLYAPKVAV